MYSRAIGIHVNEIKQCTQFDSFIGHVPMTNDYFLVESARHYVQR